MSLKASDFVRALHELRWADAASLVSPTIAAGTMSADVLRGMWTGIVAQIGALQSTEPPDVSADPPHQRVDIAARFERAEVTLRTVIGADGGVLGFWVTPPKPPAYVAPSYVDDTRFDESAILVGAEPTLPGTLTMPRGSDVPIVVLVHGSGPNDRDERVGAHRPFRDLALGLASRGIAVLRYDKRTYAHPRSLAGTRITLDVETIDDAAAAVHLARTLPNVDPSRVFILGHSLGATFAPEIAARSGKIAGVAMLAPSARPIASVVADQLAHLASLARARGDSTAALDALQPQIAQLAARLLSPDDVVLGAPAWYWYDLDDRRPVERARAFGAPMFLLFGARDYQVTLGDETLWRAALADRRDVRITSYDALDHLFVAGEGASSPEQYASRAGHVAEVVIDDLASFVEGSA